MVDETREAETPVSGLNLLLLDAKTSAPQPGRGSVSRAGLVDRARSSGRRVVGVTAPAGYGKTTLMAEWALAEDRAVAWVSLDRLDDDPAALLTLLASAWARISPDDAQVVADMRGVSMLGRAAPALAAVLHASRRPFVLMVDDLHELRSSDCQDVLGVVMRGVPPGSQVVAASRFEQPNLSRLRASGDVLDVQAVDLALDAAGAVEIFAAASVPMTPELAAAVTERTEGWPVGLYLASIIARDGHEGGAGNSARNDDAVLVTGEDRYVSDYLYRESLSRLPEDTRRFLRRTAILDQLTGPLCDEVLGEPGGQARLRELEASNVFLVPLDRRREWYRYHSLFREFLLGELRRVDPGVEDDLHRRAADWYEAHGAPAIAVEHLLLTSDRDRLAHLVTSMALPVYQAGQIATVERWLAEIGAEAVADYPLLAVIAGWITTLVGQPIEGDRWAAVVDAVTEETGEADGMTSFASAKAMLFAARAADGPEQVLRDAEFAVAQEPTWAPWRDQALVLLAEGRLLAGDTDGADQAFADASASALLKGVADIRVLSESERAVLAMDRGDWAEAADHVEVALALVDEHRMHDYATTLLVFPAAARLALHRGATSEAEAHLTRAMRGRPVCTWALPYIAVRVRLQLAKVYRAMGDRGTARHLMREIDDILLHRPALGALVDEVAAFRVVLDEGSGAVPGGGIPLTPAELRLLPYLQTHLSIREIGERLFVSRNTVSSEVGSIYRKLGVSTRSEAVDRATAVGLLGA